MKIKLQEIISFLDKTNISYSIGNRTEEEYTVASIFNLVDNGFYFSTSKTVDFQNIKNSLIMVEHAQAIDSASTNCYLLVENSQLVYYKALNYYFMSNKKQGYSNQSVIDIESQIGESVTVGNFTTIGKAIIGDHCEIGANCVIHDHVVIGNRTVIEDGSVIGAQGVAWIWDEVAEIKIRQPQLGGVTIGEDCFLGAQTVIVRGSLNEHTLVDDHSMLAPGCRIGHGTQISKAVHLANSVITGGNVHIGAHSFIGSGVVFRPKVSLHENTIVGAGTLVIKNTSTSGMTLMGSPAKEYETKEFPQGMPKPLKK